MGMLVAVIVDVPQPVALKVIVVTEVPAELTVNVMGCDCDVVPAQSPVNAAKPERPTAYIVTTNPMNVSFRMVVGVSFGPLHSRGGLETGKRHYAARRRCRQMPE